MSDEAERPSHEAADGRAAVTPVRGDRPFAERAPPSGDGATRVLHVDGDDALRETVATHLGDREIETVGVSTVAAARERLDGDDRVDCVVGEHDLPDGDGIDVVDAVHATRPTVPVVLFTDAGSEAVASDAVEAGATGYLVKRTTEETLDLLVDRIENAVSRVRTERRYRLLAEANVVGVYSIRGGRFEYVNPRLADVLGYDRSDLVGTPVETVVPPTERARVEQVLGELRSNRRTVREQTAELVRRDGERVTVEVRGVGVEPTGEKQPLVLGTMRDVTERDRSKRALRERRDRMTALHAAAANVAGADSVQAVADRALAAADEVLDMDRSVVNVVEDDKLFAVAVSDSVDREGYHDAVSLDDGSTLLAETYRSGESTLIDDLHATEYESADEGYRSVISAPLGERGVFQAAASEPAAFDEDDLQAVELLAAHVTAALDWLDGRERLEEQNERLETFASVVSHDLRNPIEVARGHLVTADVEGAAVENALDALDRMEQITDDVLRLAHGDDGVESTTPVSVESVAGDAWGSVSADGATLTVESDARIEADRRQLARLFENLLSNAVEHGGETVTVRVGALADGTDGFYVADDGPGVPETRRAEAFEAGVSDDPTGSGLGLAITETITDAHGWSIELVESTDGGARFEVRGVEPSE
ncbi:hypothetical protein BRD18_04680 [Halobacteriales archaeon SW_7_71_33]|nr:MAG: hypothetical protein BRD18_04680 [Halobacteriales archaeon SW_7_71_33]